jgi:transcriptional regulator with XRE-family HTH domain
VSGVRIGLSLRTARERRELTLAAVASELCIRADYLAALENERFDKLPGAAYARAWLRVYAEYLDLDSAPLLDVYEAEHKPPAETEIFHRPLPVGHHLPVRPLFALGLATLLLAVGGVLFLGLTAQRTVKNAQPPAVAPTPKAKPKPVKVAPVAERQPVQTAPVPVFLRAVGAWDPYGDHTEHDSEAPAATDGNLTTYWRTEDYSVALGKPGVGLLLDAGRPVAPRRVVVVTDTPGYTAVIQAGASPTGPFHAVSAPAAVSTRTAFRVRGSAQRYWVVWITHLDHVAHVDEVSAVR